jgi:D-galactosamine 6-phosphate deaminase/isomerase
MDVFGLSTQEIERAGAHWTAREVWQQPQIWLQVERLMAAQADGLSRFLAPLLAHRDLRIILTGAGTSAFIGECLALSMVGNSARRVEAIATTDLVASPQSWLSRSTPTLLVSFARSGNSPESVAALELADRYVERCSHLIVTCNADGALYQRARSTTNAYAILLPEASNDRSFAMTSSFTGMLLAAAMAFGVLPADGTSTAALARLAAQILPGCVPLLGALVQDGFERAVYLGSNELKGLAREAALKMLELTDGRVVASADAPLGFRHGPKTILNRDSLVVVFLCNNPYTRQYEVDLVTELRRDAVAGRVVALSTALLDAQHGDDVVLSSSTPDARQLSDLELCFPYALFAQSLALLRSLSLGVRPDSPNAAGTVSRVVQGVSIYPWHGVR